VAVETSFEMVLEVFIKVRLVPLLSPGGLLFGTTPDDGLSPSREVAVPSCYVFMGLILTFDLGHTGRLRRFAVSPCIWLSLLLLLVSFSVLKIFTIFFLIWALTRADFCLTWRLRWKHRKLPNKRIGYFDILQDVVNLILPLLILRLFIPIYSITFQFLTLFYNRTHLRRHAHDILSKLFVQSLI
jgi:hypothetical protein